ncbi:MAG: hypothetical protein N4A31_04395 [Rickettsiales bacterium]|jgi:Sec-independent protein translocase protein TatA|nr:hypothetical protein [Rickettsiales bacterium]
MFDIGWTEIIVVVIVSCLALDIKDIPKILRTIKQAMRYLGNLTDEIKTFFIDLEEETKTILDLDGKEQKTYDLNHIKPDIKNSKSDEDNEKKL